MTRDLSTNYLGLKLRNPLIASSSPLTGELDVLRRLEANGVAAVVLPSLFEEQIDLPAFKAKHPEAFQPHVAGHALTAFHQMSQYNHGPKALVELLTQAKSRLSIPVMASLNGTTTGAWLRHAQLLEEAGADALEMNMYSVICDPQVTAAQIEDQYVDLVAEVCGKVKIPVAVKIGPYYTALSNLAHRFAQAGAKGMVMFNRFMQPDVNVDAMRVWPHLTLSTPDELRPALRWIAILRGQLDISLAATGGVHYVDGLIKALVAGADVAMIASVLYRNGIDVIPTLLKEFECWLDAGEYHSVAQLKGCLSQINAPDPSVFERANYMRAMTEFVSGNGNH